MPHGDTLTLTNRQLLALARGLSSLDAVKEGQDILGFSFNREVQWRLVLASVAADAGKLAYERAERALAKEHAVFEGMPVNAENNEKLAAYTADLEQLRDCEIDVSDMPRFTMAELLDRLPSDDKKAAKVNRITQSTLRNLAPILTET